MSYNGWKNYETWNVNLWLDNDGSDEIIREMAADYRDDTNGLAHAIQEMIEENMPDLGASMFSDLLSAAMREVDWYEIAEHYIDDLEPEEDEETETDSDNA